MKKPCYPTTGEIEKTIAAYQHRHELREQLDQKDHELKRSQNSLRVDLLRYLFLTDNPNAQLADYINLYRRRGHSAQDIDEHLDAMELLAAEYDAIQMKLKEGEADLHARAMGICAHVEGMLRTKHEAIISKVAESLLPYCNGDDRAARHLAESTPKAAEYLRQRTQLYPSIYPDGDIMTPLRNVLEVVSSNTQEVEHAN